jgi:hypothetical protein
MTVGHGSEWMRELRDSLRGSRRGKCRLLAELEAHLEDAVAEGVADGLGLAEAEAAAVARLGPAVDAAEHWNADASARRSFNRFRILALGIAVAAVAAPVSLAQRSDRPSHRSPKPAPKVVRQERGAAPGRAR